MVMASETDSLIASPRSGRSSRKLGRHSPDAEREIRHLRESLQVERKRTDDAEAKTREVLAHLKTVNEARVRANQEAAQAVEELKLYKIQLDNAQREIYRAQEVVRTVDKQRLDAEKEAADLRTRVRRLVEENNLQRAMEQGRQQGMKEGLEKGRELGLLEGRIRGYRDDPPQSDRRVFEHPSSSSSSSSSTNYRPPSSRSAQPPPRPSSHTGSVVQSVASRRSVETLSHYEDPVPVPPPVPRKSPRQQSDPTVQVANHETDFPRPVSIRNRTPSPVHSPAFIIPDNYIPQIDADNVIRLPPPHEFLRSPTRSEHATSPLPDLDANDRRQPNSRTGTPYRRARRHSSPESNSTTISQMDLVNDPDNHQGLRTPMSAIPEVLSSQTSPNQSGEHELRRQPSFAGSTRTQRSQRSVTTAASQGNPADLPIYTRPSTIPPPDVAQHTLDQLSQSSLGSAPPISVQAPSSPSISGTILNDPQQLSTPATNRQQTPLPSEPPSFSMPSPPPEQVNFPPPIVLDSNELPPNFVPMSYTPAPTFAQLQQTNNEANTSSDGPPVIPDSALFGTDSEDSEGSLDTLTTPPPTRRHLDQHQRAASDAGTHYTGAQVPLPPSTVAGTPHPAWLGGSTTGGAAQVPLPPSTVAGTPRSVRGGANMAGAANGPPSPFTTAGTPWMGSSTAGLESTTDDTPYWRGSTIGKTPRSKSQSSSRKSGR